MTPPDLPPHACPSPSPSASPPLRLLSRLPSLAGRLPFVRLGTYPTPLERMAAVERALPLPPGTELWVKRDDLSGEPWGTSKVRKLEHYLGDALARGARRVATVGPLGSNHALATAIYGRRLGLDVLLTLWPEPRGAGPKVREALLVEAALGARHVLLGTADERALADLADALPPPSDGETVFIPPAGTDEVGATGYVECGLELAADLASLDGGAGRETVVHVAGGTGGVAAGLAVGFALAAPQAAGERVVAGSGWEAGTGTGASAGADPGMKPVVRVAAVRCVAKEVLSISRLLLLARRIEARLGSLAGAPIRPAGPPVSREAFLLLDGFAGDGYARPTEEGARAAALLHAGAGLLLDATYTAKAAAGMLAFAASPEGAGRRHVFLHTYGERDLSAIAARATEADLPEGIRGCLTAAP